jgi:uncharacterized protein YegL
MYSKLISTANPGLFVILVDQSSSMEDQYANSTKANYAALQVNQCIYAILSASRQEEKVHDRCHIAVIGYGASTGLILTGRASELMTKVIRNENYKRQELDQAGNPYEASQTLPVWVEARHDNGTPMADALELAVELVGAWIRDKGPTGNENSDSFPPVIFNITDGKPNDLTGADAPETRRAAERLAALSTKDGSVLIANCHIGEQGGPEIKLPASAGSLTEPEARFFFEISSVIPAELFAAAQSQGLTPQSGSRFFVMNAAPDTFVNLLTFGSIRMRR